MLNGNKKDVANILIKKSGLYNLQYLPKMDIEHIFFEISQCFFLVGQASDRDFDSPQE